MADIRVGIFSQPIYGLSSLSYITSILTHNIRQWTVTILNGFWIPSLQLSYAGLLMRRRESSKEVLTSTQSVIFPPNKSPYTYQYFSIDAYSTDVAKTPEEGIEACASDMNNPHWPRMFSLLHQTGVIGNDNSDNAVCVDTSDVSSHSLVTGWAVGGAGLVSSLPCMT